MPKKRKPRPTLIDDSAIMDADPYKLRPDAAEIAFRTMLEATGQAPKTVPGEGPKNPAAVELGRAGGKKSGAARSTTPRKKGSAPGKHG
jgi:hypothetical protein